MRGDGARGQEQPVGDLAVGQAAAGQDDDLALLRGEFRQRGRCAGRGIDAHPACPQLGLSALRPCPSLQLPEGLQCGGQERLGLVDPAAPAHPFAVVELQLRPLERPAVPFGV